MSVLAPDGSFEFKGLSKAVYTLFPGVRGYTIPKAKQMKCAVDRDRADIVLHLERAKPRN